MWERISNISPKIVKIEKKKELRKMQLMKNIENEPMMNIQAELFWFLSNQSEIDW